MNKTMLSGAVAGAIASLLVSISASYLDYALCALFFMLMHVLTLFDYYFPERSDAVFMQYKKVLSNAYPNVELVRLSEDMYDAYNVSNNRVFLDFLVSQEDLPYVIIITRHTFKGD